MHDAWIKSIKNFGLNQYNINSCNNNNNNQQSTIDDNNQRMICMNGIEFN